MRQGRSGTRRWFGNGLKPYSSIPTIKGLPFVGNALMFSPKNPDVVRVKGDYAYLIFEESLRQNTNILKINMFGVDWVFVRDPAVVKRMVVDDLGSFVKGPKEILQPIADLAPTNMFTSDGELWHKHRKTIQPAFTAKELRRLVPNMTEEIQRFIDEIHEESNVTEIVDVSRNLRRLTLDVIGNAGFGVKFRGKDDKNSEVGDLISEILQSINTTVLQPWKKLNPFFVNKVNKSSAVMKNRILTLVSERRKDIEQSKTSTSQDRNDILSVLLESQRNEEESKHLSDQEISDECILFVGAGHETTATTLSWCFFFVISTLRLAGKAERRSFEDFTCEYQRHYS
jgi:cytochrome P450